MKPFRVSASPPCEVCGRPLVRHDGAQVVRFHPECRPQRPRRKKGSKLGVRAWGVTPATR